MLQRKKKKIDRAAEREAGLKTTGRDRRGHRRPRFAIASVVVAIILIIVGIFYYQSYVAPFQRPVITVDNTVINMGYFLKRTKISGDDPTTLLQQLAYEQIVKLKAPDFTTEPTPQDINDTLLYIASTSNNTAANVTAYLTESEFKKWYREQLNQTGLSDAEYKEITRTNLLAAGLQQYLAERIPTTGEQVHLNVILVANSADADKVMARIKAGESFAAVAREVSLDTQSKESGGDIGWVPRGVLSYDQTIFGLGIGGVSDPVAVDSTTPDSSQYLLFMVSEKASSREIDENSMQVLKSNALISWLTQEMPSHNIKINYDFNNLENQAWINLQLTKMSKND
jgi:hypothetical protein